MRASAQSVLDMPRTHLSTAERLYMKMTLPSLLAVLRRRNILEESQDFCCCLFGSNPPPRLSQPISYLCLSLSSPGGHTP
jgi:hypothetical protein